MRMHQSMGEGVGGHQHPIYDGGVRLHRIARGTAVSISQREADGFLLKSQWGGGSHNRLTPTVLYAIMTLRWEKRSPAADF